MFFECAFLKQDGTGPRFFEIQKQFCSPRSQMRHTRSYGHKTLKVSIMEESTRFRKNILPSSALKKHNYSECALE